MESRLSRRSVKQSKNQLYGSLIAIVVIIVAALTIGPYLIGATGTFIDKITGKTGQGAAIVSDASIQPPDLDPLSQATPSAQITITGRTDYQNGKIELYVNNDLFGETNVDSDQTFKFENVSLRSGNNSIQARIIINNKKSNLSAEQDIVLSKNAPNLNISNPSDHQGFSKVNQITVNGTTDAQNSITVNGFTAIVDNSGNFSYQMNLTNGDNKISVVATDPAGQTTTKEITVSYSE